MGLGAQIQAALTALPAADKRDFVKTWDAIGVILDGISSPVGAVVPFAGASVPAGWLLCNGAAVSRATYAALFAVIGTTYGVGNGTTTFNLPDTRGIFIRGAGTSGKLSNANGGAFAGTLGTYENDKMQGHWHSLPNTVGSVSGPFSEAAGSFVTSTSNPPVTDGVNGPPRTGAETSPANLSLNHIIRF